VAHCVPYTVAFSSSRTTNDASLKKSHGWNGGSRYCHEKAKLPKLTRITMENRTEAIGVSAILGGQPEGQRSVYVCIYQVIVTIARSKSRRYLATPPDREWCLGLMVDPGDSSLGRLVRALCVALPTRWQ
jgi:hypothetical protein